MSLQEKINYYQDIILTGGIGDALVALSFWYGKPRKALLATPQAGLIGELFRHLKIPIEIIESQKTFKNKAEVEQYHGQIDAYDCSMVTFFQEIKDKKHKYQGCPLLELDLPDRVQFEYDLVIPYSQNDFPGRSMTEQDLQWIYNKTTRPLVVCQYGDNKINKRYRVLDYTNRTSLIEAVALIKHATRIFTIDSWQSILASQTKKPVKIKAVNPRYYDYRFAYNAGEDGNVEVVPWFVGEDTQEKLVRNTVFERILTKQHPFVKQATPV